MLKFMIMVLILALVTAHGYIYGSGTVPLGKRAYVAFQYDGPARMNRANSIHGVQIGFKQRF